MPIRVRVPATSANLGPGFDALGLALGLYNEVIAEEADRIEVAVDGEGASTLATGADNVVVRGARLAFETAGRTFRGAAIRCVNRIPLSRGLGSSAAAWVGGLVGANALLGEPIDREGLLSLATQAEGHPDNVAAALCGGLTVSSADGQRVTAIALDVPADLHWIVVVPEIESATREARAVLPAEVPRADAVFNVQRVSLFLASIVSGRVDLLGDAMRDRLHQPYRLRLFPWMDGVIAAAHDAGALGCVLSGAGPSMLAACAPRASRAVAASLEAAMARAGITGRALQLDVARGGATWTRD